MTCTIPPNVSLHVTITTTGAGTDPDGYLVQVDAGAAQAIAVNGVLDVANLIAGQHTLTLSGMAAGCTLQTSQPTLLRRGDRTGDARRAHGDVQARGTSVTTTTTGGGTDPDGYLVRVDKGAARVIAVDGVLDVTDLTTGQHAVTLKPARPPTARWDQPTR